MLVNPVDATTALVTADTAEASVVNRLVAVDLKLAIVNTRFAVAVDDAIALHCSDESEIQPLASQAVGPIPIELEYSITPKLTPLTVMLTAPVVGLLPNGREALLKLR
jgi:hypothetical protein